MCIRDRVKSVSYDHQLTKSNLLQADDSSQSTIVTTASYELTKNLVLAVGDSADSGLEVVIDHQLTKSLSLLAEERVLGSVEVVGVEHSLTKKSAFEVDDLAAADKIDVVHSLTKNSQFGVDDLGFVVLMKIKSHLLTKSVGVNLSETVDATVDDVATDHQLTKLSLIHI